MRVLLFLFSLKVSAQILNTCEVNPWDCHIYSCAEEQYQCGKRHYLTGFGEKYCKLFIHKQLTELYSDELDDWLTKVRVCLQKELKNTPYNLSCREIADYSLKSHVKCYEESGFCDLPRKDKRILFHLLIPALNSKYLFQILVQSNEIKALCHKVNDTSRKSFPIHNEMPRITP